MEIIDFSSVTLFPKTGAERGKTFTTSYNIFYKTTNFTKTERTEAAATTKTPT